MQVRGRNKRARRAAFTLVELLVVITIIAVLAALLMPALKGARDKAKQASCLSNVKQFMTATQMYGQDYRDTIPNATIGPWWQLYSGAPGGFHPGATGIHGLLDPYLKSDAIWYCPSIRPTDIAFPMYSQTLTWRDNQSSYRWYEYASTNFVAVALLSGVPTVTVPKPAAQPIISDAYDWGSGVHASGVNIGYLDGHAQWDRLPSTMAYYYAHSYDGFK